MTWVRLDDGASQHRKVLAAGAEAAWLWACGLMYANRQPAKDGIIPAVALPILYPLRQPAKLAAKLVEVGLWEAVDGGWRVHDYHDYQPSVEDAEALREKRSEAGRRGGLRSGESRRSNEATDEANAKQVASKQTQANGKQNEPPSRSRPVPEEQTTMSASPTGGGGTAPEPAKPSAVDDVYGTYIAARKRHNPRSRPNPTIQATHRQAILALLRGGRTVEDLKLACDGLVLSAHHTGSNDRHTEYLDFKYVLKNLEAFIGYAEAAALADAEPALKILRLPDREAFIPKPDEQPDFSAYFADEAGQ